MDVGRCLGSGAILVNSSSLFLPAVLFSFLPACLPLRPCFHPKLLRKETTKKGIPNTNV